MAAEDTTTEEPPQLLDELLAVVPRLVDRTRSQAEFARSVASLLPCVGSRLGRRHEEHGGGVPEHERVDVLSVLADESADPTAVEPDAAVHAEAAGVPAPASAPTDEAAPAESELPIQDYDSLAASQVVPRLATLSPDELRAVLAYETSTRHRQTILNRVAQLLSS
jgi:hypothetical protein